MAKTMQNEGNGCIKHKGQQGSCIAARAGVSETLWALERGQAGFQLIYPGSSLKKDFKYSSTRAISMQMIRFSQNLQSAQSTFCVVSYGRLYQVDWCNLSFPRITYLTLIHAHWRAAEQKQKENKYIGTEMAFVTDI